MPELKNTGKDVEYEELRSRILNMWSGFHGPLYTSTEIAAEFNITRNKVIGIVMRARALGDLRAVVRAPAPKVRKIQKVWMADRTPARNGEGAFVRPVPPAAATAPPAASDFAYLQSSAFCFSKNAKAKTVLNLGYDECHYPLESVTNDGFRIYCGLDATETMQAHQKAYCQEHYKRMFYKKDRRSPRRNFYRGMPDSEMKEGRE
jgi:hypothetical protein